MVAPGLGAVSAAVWPCGGVAVRETLFVVCGRSVCGRSCEGDEPHPLAWSRVGRVHRAVHRACSVHTGVAVLCSRAVPGWRTPRAGTPSRLKNAVRVHYCSLAPGRVLAPLLPHCAEMRCYLTERQASSS